MTLSSSQQEHESVPAYNYRFYQYRQNGKTVTGNLFRCLSRACNLSVNVLFVTFQSRIVHSSVPNPAMSALLLFICYCNVQSSIFSAPILALYISETLHPYSFLPIFPRQFNPSNVNISRDIVSLEPKDCAVNRKDLGFTQKTTADPSKIASLQHSKQSVPAKRFQVVYTVTVIHLKKCSFFEYHNFAIFLPLMRTSQTDLVFTDIKAGIALAHGPILRFFAPPEGAYRSFSRNLAGRMGPKNFSEL